MMFPSTTSALQGKGTSAIGTWHLWPWGVVAASRDSPRPRENKRQMQWLWGHCLSLAAAPRAELPLLHELANFKRMHRHMPMPWASMPWVQLCWEGAWLHLHDTGHHGKHGTARTMTSPSEQGLRALSWKLLCS